MDVLLHYLSVSLKHFQKEKLYAETDYFSALILFCQYTCHCIEKLTVRYCFLTIFCFHANVLCTGFGLGLFKLGSF